MVSAAGGFGELPILPMTALLIVILVASVISVATVRWTLGDQLTDADSVFMRDTLLANTTSYVNHCAAELVIYICNSQSQEFNNTNSTISAFTEIPLGIYSAIIMADGQDVTLIIDRATIGEVTGPSFGMLGSQYRPIAERVLTGPGLLFTATSTGHKFYSTSPRVFYIGLVQTGLINPMLSLLFAGVFNVTGLVNMSDFEFVMAQHMLVHHWYDEIQSVFAKLHAEYVESVPIDVNGVIYTMPIVVIVVAFCAVLVFIWFLSRTQRAIHFCLMSLSMVDYDVIMENTVLSNFLSGLFPTSERDVLSESALMKAVTSVSQDIVLHLRPDGVVTSANRTIEERWGIRVLDCVDVELSLLLEFPATVANRLVTNMDIEITLVFDRSVIPVNSFVFVIERDKEVLGYIMFLEDLREQRGNAALLQSELARSKELVKSVIPRALQAKVTETNGTLTYVAPWVAVLCTQISDFPEFARRQTSLETIRKFRTAIAAKIADIAGVAALKGVGVSEYFMFNAAGELGDADATIPVIWRVCQELAQAARELELAVQFGVSAENDVAMGLMSTDDLSFDIFARVVRTSRVLASRAPQNAANVDKIALQTFPAVVKCTSRTVTFKVGSSSYPAYECTIAP
jgi:hypothetical protein